jgi:hypothetical protein
MDKDIKELVKERRVAFGMQCNAIASELYDQLYEKIEKWDGCGEAPTFTFYHDNLDIISRVHVELTSFGLTVSQPTEDSLLIKVEE